MAQASRVIDGHLVPNGYQQVTSLSAAAALTVPKNTVLTVIQAETRDVRWRDDGTNPTASVGMILFAGDTFFYNGDASALRFIEAAASAKLNVSYYA